jgi:hypothetical protein
MLPFGMAVRHPGRGWGWGFPGVQRMQHALVLSTGTGRIVPSCSMHL